MALTPVPPAFEFPRSTGSRILPACTREGAIRAYVYCRVSTREQATDNHHSLANQEARCREHIKQRCRHPVKALKDVGSGKSAERPNYQELLLAIGSKRADVVVVYRRDRLSRNAVDVSNALDALSPGGVGIAGVRAASALDEHHFGERHVWNLHRRPVPVGSHGAFTP